MNALIKDFDEKIKKSLQEEFTKVPESDMILNNNNESSQNNNDQLDELIPREDILPKINQEIQKLLNSNSWQEKKLGIESIEKIVDSTCNRVNGAPLRDIIDILKNLIKDKNKPVQKQCIILLGKLGLAMGKTGHKFRNMIVPQLISVLSDKNQNMRQDAMHSINMWSDSIGCDYIVLCGREVLSDNSVELRTDLLNFLSSDRGSKGISLCQNKELKEYVGPLISCLNDKNMEIRKLSEKVICLFFNKIGTDLFRKHVSDKPQG